MNIDELSMQINWAINTNDNRTASNLLTRVRDKKSMKREYIKDYTYSGDHSAMVA